MWTLIASLWSLGVSVAARWEVRRSHRLVESTLDEIEALRRRMAVCEVKAGVVLGPGELRVVVAAKDGDGFGTSPSVPTILSQVDVRQ